MERVTAWDLRIGTTSRLVIITERRDLDIHIHRVSSSHDDGPWLHEENRYTVRLKPS
jgi:hypothetical protein